MARFDYDLFVIGAGSGGVRAARVAASFGAKVAIAEEHRIGGTCVIRGCVPKKLLYYGSLVAREFRQAGSYGWSFDNSRFDWAVLRDFVANEVTRLNGLYTKTLESHAVTTFMERAAIASPNCVRLASGLTVSARRILIAVGSWPIVPAFAGSELCITSNEIFDLPELPRCVVIKGGGYIAIEFAFILDALGTKVTVVNRSDIILRDYERSTSERLLEIGRQRGIDFKFHSTIERVEAVTGGGLQVVLRAGETVSADEVIVAAGRRPKTDELGLANAGIESLPSGAVEVDSYFQTSCESVFAIGDAISRVQLTPVAIREGQAFAETQFGGCPKTVSYRNIPSAVFSQPPLAGVGLTEEEARARYGNIKVYESDFRPMKDSFSKKPERGFIKLITDARTDQVVGLHIIAPDAPEVLQAAAIAVNAGLTKSQFDDTVALHPSMAEELVLLKERQA